jgi:mono/diheme cytochrome c family protein
MKRTVELLLAGVLLLALLAFTVGCGDDGGSTTTAGGSDTTASSGEGADGTIVFAKVCSGCHGIDGSGGTGPDLTARTDLTEERIVYQVTNGGSRMPAYGGQLSSDEISAVAAYVLSDVVGQ